MGYLLNRLSGAAAAATTSADCQESDDTSDDEDESDLDIGVEEQASSHQSHPQEEYDRHNESRPENPHQ